MAIFELSPIGLCELLFKLFPSNAKNEQKQKAEILFRSLYAECVNNIHILDSFKRDSFTKENTFRAVKSIAPLLKNEFAQLLLLGTDGSLEELRIMQNNIEQLEIEQEDDCQKDKITKAKTLQQAIAFCVNKIQFLKNYAMIDESNTDLFHELNLKTRIDNIYNYSKQIKKQLHLHMPATFE